MGPIVHTFQILSKIQPSPPAPNNNDMAAKVLTESMTKSLVYGRNNSKNKKGFQYENDH